jgi:PKD repeat protein
MFNDTSTNTPTTWHWIMTPGGWDSHLQNFTHAFDTVGLYTAELTAGNAYGDDVETKVDYIDVTDCSPIPTPTPTPAVISFATRCYIQVNALNATPVDNITWDFGDGSVYDYTQTATHWFDWGHSYLINLTITNGTDVGNSKMYYDGCSGNSGVYTMNPIL